jgi:hypothetical protein
MMTMTTTGSVTATAKGISHRVQVHRLQREYHIEYRFIDGRENITSSTGSSTAERISHRVQVHRRQSISHRVQVHRLPREYHIEYRFTYTDCREYITSSTINAAPTYTASIHLRCVDNIQCTIARSVQIFLEFWQTSWSYRDEKLFAALGSNSCM